MLALKMLGISVLFTIGTLLYPYMSSFRIFKISTQSSISLFEKIYKFVAAMNHHANIPGNYC